MVGIIDSSLSLKLQLDATLTLKKAIDAARQSEAAKREQAQMRNFLPKTSSSTFDFAKAKRQPKSHPTKTKMAPKPQSTSRKCNFWGRSPAHEKSMCPAWQATCFNYRKVGHFGIVADQRSQLMRSPNTPIRKWRPRGGDKE